jgi:hypothetical protein
MEETDKVKKLAPPYLSWKTFIGFVKSFDQGLPPRIDKSAMSRLSGGNQNQVSNALTYLNLVKADGRPEPLLEQIIDSLSPERKAEYQDHLKTMLKNAYSFLFDGTDNFDLARSTSAQFDEKFRAEGVTGETVQKCEAFFIAAAQEAVIPISRLILDAKKKGPKRVISGGTSRSRFIKPDPKDHDETPLSPPADPKPPVQEFPIWYLTYKPAFDLLPKFSTNPKPKWTVEEEENFINLVKALTTAYIERADKKKA